MPSRPPPPKPAAAPDRRLGSPFAELTAGLRGNGSQGGVWARAGELLRRVVTRPGAKGQGRGEQVPTPAATHPPPPPPPPAAAEVAVASPSAAAAPTKAKKADPGAKAAARRRLAAASAAGSAPAKPHPPAPNSHGGIAFAAPSKTQTPPQGQDTGGPSLATLKTALMSRVTRMDSILNALSGMGDNGDIGSSNQVDMQRGGLAVEECLQLYRFNGYAARVVEELPQDVCQKGWSVASQDVPSEQQASLGSAEAKDLHLVSSVETAMTWGRLTGAGAILMVCDEVVPPQDRSRYLAQPLGTYPIRRIRALHVFDRTELSIYDWEGNATSRRYRAPKHYTITPRVPTDSIEIGVPVHASRLLMFSGRRLPEQLKTANSGFDDSVLQMTFDAIVGCTAVDKVGQTLVQKLSTTTLSTTALEEMDGPEMLLLLRERARMIAEQFSNQNLLLLQPGETVASQGVQITGYGDIANRAALQLCAASGMPATRLFGEAPAGFNTDGVSQEKLWDRRVVIEQERIRPPLHQFYNALFASQEGPTGGQMIEYDISFPPTTTLTASEEATIRQSVAQADQIYLTNGVFTPQEVRATRGQVDGHLKDLVVQAEAPGEDEQLLAADQRAREEEDRLLAAEQAAAQASDPSVNAAVPAEGVPGPATMPQAGEIAPRMDAEPGSAVIWIELPPEAIDAHTRLIGVLEKAVPELAIAPALPPHITLLYLGVLDDPKSNVELIKKVMDEFAKAWPVFKVETGTLRTFPVQEEDAPVPLTLSIHDGEWHLGAVHLHLLRRLAHIVRAEQFDKYAPHATLGYAQMSATTRDAVMQVKLPEVTFTATRMRLVMDGAVVHETVFPGHGWPGGLATI